MMPLNGQRVHFLFLIISGAGAYTALQLWRIRQRDSFVFIYLIAVLLLSLPYFLGRSSPSNIYPISLPALLLVGLMLDSNILKRSFLGRLTRMTFLFLLGVVCLHSLVILVCAWQQPLHTVRTVQSVVRQAVIDRPVRTTGQFEFLNAEWDHHCPLVIISEHEQELLPELQAKPALAMTFFHANVFSQEQIDALLSMKHQQPFCVFISNSELLGNQAMSDVYAYFLAQISPFSQPLSTSSYGDYRLEKILIP